jgi:hypothetical protein
MNKSLSQLANELEIDLARLEVYRKKLDEFYKRNVLGQKVTSDVINLGLNGYEEYLAILSINNEEEKEKVHEDLPF